MTLQKEAQQSNGLKYPEHQTPLGWQIPNGTVSPKQFAGEGFPTIDEIKQSREYFRKLYSAGDKTHGEQFIEAVGSYIPLVRNFTENETHEHEIQSTIRELFQTCSYMKPKELKMVRTALELMKYGHQGQKRKKSEKPYVIHTLQVALEISKKYKPDWVTITSALCHDLLEDSELNKFPVTYDHLRIYLSEEVAKTVFALSKVRQGDTVQKEKVSEETRGILFASVWENPRAAIIKLYDRMHNMRDISEFSPQVARSKADETLRYYVPLAQFLGMYDEMNILATASLRVLYGDTYVNGLQKTLSEYHDMMERTIEGKKPRQHIVDRIATSLHMKQKDREKIKVYYPDIYAVHKSTRGMSHISTNDDFLMIDLDVDTTHFHPSGNLVSSWMDAAWVYRKKIGQKKDIEVIGSLQIDELESAQIEQRKIPLESEFRFNRKNGSYLAKVNFYSPGGSELIQIPIADMYSSDPQVRKLGMKKFRLLRKQLHGFSKEGYLGRMWNKVLPDAISVIGTNFEAESEWKVRQGATALDYAVDVLGYDNWMKCTSVEVNGEVVDMDYVLNSGDKIYLYTSDAKVAKPEWMKALSTSDESYRVQLEEFVRNEFRRETENGEMYAMVKREAIRHLEGLVGEKIYSNLVMIKGLILEVQKNIDGNKLDGIDLLSEFMLQISLGRYHSVDSLKRVVEMIQQHQNDYLVRIKVKAKDARGIQDALSEPLIRMFNKQANVGLGPIFGSRDYSEIEFIIDVSEQLEEFKKDTIISFLQEYKTEISREYDIPEPNIAIQLPVKLR